MYSDGSSLQRLSRDECLTLLASVPVVTDPGELARLRTMGLKSWAPGERDHFIRISPVMLKRPTPAYRLRAAGLADGVTPHRCGRPAAVPATPLCARYLRRDRRPAGRANQGRRDPAARHRRRSRRGAGRAQGPAGPQGVVGDVCARPGARSVSGS